MKTKKPLTKKTPKKTTKKPEKKKSVGATVKKVKRISSKDRGAATPMPRIQKLQANISTVLDTSFEQAKTLIDNGFTRADFIAQKTWKTTRRNIYTGLCEITPSFLAYQRRIEQEIERRQSESQ